MMNSGRENTPFRIAVLTTAYFPLSHADVFVSRWFEKFADDESYGWLGPQSEIVSLYIMQYGPWPVSRSDRESIGREKAEVYGIPLYGSIEAALTGGGERLAVDGVLLLAEHGDFPSNSLGQKLYPRKEFFDEIVSVFEKYSGTASVFVDKHYSWSLDQALEMDTKAREMGFMLFGGSSVPWCQQVPAISKKLYSDAKEVCSVFSGPIESYGYHGIELGQSLLEKRSGGDSGIKSVTSYVGEAAWTAVQSGLVDGALLEAAINSNPGKKDGNFIEHSRSEEKANPNNSHEFPDQLYEAGFGRAVPVLSVFEYADGVRLILARIEGFLEPESSTRFCASIRCSDGTSPIGFHPRMKGEHAPNFAALSRMVDDSFVQRRRPFPRERSLLTTGMTEALMKSLTAPGILLETPQLMIPYEKSGYDSVFIQKT